MSTIVARFTTTSPEQTAHVAAQIAQRLHAGDTLLLTGDIGAGKTHFARAAIQSLQEEPEDVPSPTFTLVQIYDTRAGELWHADLYRLSGPDEIVETGLLDALDTSICVIEWPDRLGPDAPSHALTLSFETTEQEDSRRIICTSSDPARWAHRLEVQNA